MNTIKPYLAFIALVMLYQPVDAQVFRGRYFNPIKGDFNWDGGRFKNEFTVPYQLKSTSDTGSIAYFNGNFYGKKVVNGVERYVLFLDSTSLSSVPSRQIFQYSENLDVTQADTVTALVLNNTNPNTANRTVTLKAPSEGLTMYIYNYNSGIFANLLASPIKEYNNATVSILENETSYTLIGDGSFWRVVSKAGLSTSGGGGGGGSAGSIVIWD